MAPNTRNKECTMKKLFSSEIFLLVLGYPVNEVIEEINIIKLYYIVENAPWQHSTFQCNWSKWS